MIPDRKFPFRITFTTTSEQSAALDALAATSMTNVSAVLRQILQLYFAHVGAPAPRQMANGHHVEQESVS